MANLPAARLKYKGRDGTRYDVGVLWPGRSGSGGYTLSPEKVTDTAHRYPKMRLSDACRLVEGGEGFIDVWMTADDGRARTAAGERSLAKHDADNDGSDIPF